MFLPKLEQTLFDVFTEFKPEFVVYNAGTDCMAGDPLGDLDISP